MKMKVAAIVSWTFDHLPCHLWEFPHCHNPRSLFICSFSFEADDSGYRDRNLDSVSISASQIMPHPGTYFVISKHWRWLYFLWVCDKGRLIVGEKKETKVPGEVIECSLHAYTALQACSIDSKQSEHVGLQEREQNLTHTAVLTSQVFTDTVLSHPKFSLERVQCSWH